MRFPALFLLPALLLAGCGALRPATGAVPTGLSAKRAALAPAEVLARAEAYAQRLYGDDLLAYELTAFKAFDNQGAPLPAKYRVHLIGHLRGEAGLSTLRVDLSAAGAPSVHPVGGGPFPVRDDAPARPVLGAGPFADPTAAMARVSRLDFFKKNAPAFDVSWSLAQDFKLKRPVLAISWAVDRGADVFICDAILDPRTGALVETRGGDRPATR